MAELIGFFIPDQLDILTLLFLLVVSIFTCFISTAVGIGGGVTLMAVMSLFFPPTILIPVHGFIQLGSIVGRIALLWRNVAWPVLISFGTGGAIGAYTGAQLLVELPQGFLEIGIGAFIIWSCFGNLPVLKQGSIFKLGISGALTSALSLFVGVTGPIVAAIIKGMKFDRLTHIATFSACMFTQQSFKILTFGLLGFSFYPYLPFLVLMIVFGFIGTFLGRLVLNKINEKTFKLFITALLTILGFRLVITGITSL